jgi:hypothetical protein
VPDVEHAAEPDRDPEGPAPAAPGQRSPTTAPPGPEAGSLPPGVAHLPAHSTARPLRQAAVLNLQRRQGNQFVQRQLKPAGARLPVQRGLWGMDKPPAMPQNFPDMTQAVATLKNPARSTSTCHRPTPIAARTAWTVSWRIWMTN